MDESNSSHSNDGLPPQTDSPNNEALTEKLAQSQHENKRLRDELDYLRQHSSIYEDSLSRITESASMHETKVKSYEQTIGFLKQLMNEKDHTLETLENNYSQLMTANLALKENNDELRNELRYVKDEHSMLLEKVQYFKVKETELTYALNEFKEEKSRLMLEIDRRTEEFALSFSSVNNLKNRVKELEEERAELLERLKVIKPNAEEEYSPELKPYPNPLKTFDDKETEADISISRKRIRLDFDEYEEECFHNGSRYEEATGLSLQEELCQTEIRDKEAAIQNLELVLSEKDFQIQLKEDEILQLQRRLDELLHKIDFLGERNEELEYEYFSLKDEYEGILELFNGPDGQTGENKPLTGEAALSVTIKDGVQTSQPGPYRIIETVSIASQTDPVKILSPDLPHKTSEDSNRARSLSISDSDEEFPSLSPTDEHDGRRLFSEHKNSDLDMDIYRSCRKLSVLPEEENDEALNRIPSFKNSIINYPKSYSAKLSPSFKTQSADDVTNIDKRNHKPFGKQVSSCVDIVLTTHLNEHSRLSIRDSPVLTSKFSNESPICDNTASDNNDKAEEKSVNNSNELQLPILDPADALRQPHSFDSYLDPQQIQSSSLARQISDPTQNTVFAPPITRRGSYIKRPRSTCRPLRLPCDENGKKKEERIYKVRFDLSENSKMVDNINGNKGPILASSLKNTNNNNEKTRVVSRFRVEVVDEDEFRKSLEEGNKNTVRKRPPLIHSVVYKKSVLTDLTPFEISEVALESPKAKTGESPDSPSYDTATENSPMDSGSYESNYLIADIYPCKRRKQSDSSCYSAESQDSIEGNDIFVKSIKLHANSECIVMKDLGRESPSHSSLDADIPFIDADDMPVVKPSPEISKTTQTDVSCFVDTISTASSTLERKLSNESFVSTSLMSSPTSDSSSGTFLTPCGDITPVSDISEASLAPKSSSLSKSPTVLKNLANFEVYFESVSPTPSKKMTHSIQSEVLEEEDEENEKTITSHPILKRNSSDMSETSDTVTYVTVTSTFDNDSDTYVTIRSDRSFERKFSDMSENSSSPYNTPPSTSSNSFCTPPDTYSPILNRLSKHLAPSNSSETDSPKSLTRSSSPHRRNGNSGCTTNTSSFTYDTPPNLSPFSSPPSSSPYKVNHPYSPLQDSFSEPESVTIYNIEDANFPKDETAIRKELIIFDSPKLEFYETNDSVENLEAFLKKEEGLQEPSPSEEYPKKPCSFDSLDDNPTLSKHNSLDSPSGVGEFKFLRSKRHPPLSRQNSTEEYNFLDPHDSCLNLSEEISSPSTTPDTSNKTVIFKNKPLTVSNTIDLDDDDFPISESEIHINFNGSQTEILEIPVNPEKSDASYDIYSCRSEPCIPSIPSTADLPELSRLCKQSCSVTDDTYDLPYTKSETKPPEIIVSNLSSESEQSDSEGHCGILIDFASNASDRSEIHLSDLNSLSGHSDNVNSNSDPSDNNPSSELPVSDSDRSHSISPEVSDGSPVDKPSDASKVPNPKTNPSEEHFIDIPERLNTSDVGNLTVIDLPSSSTGKDTGNPQETTLLE